MCVAGSTAIPVGNPPTGASGWAEPAASAPEAVSAAAATASSPARLPAALISAASSRTGPLRDSSGSTADGGPAEHASETAALLEHDRAGRGAAAVDSQPPGEGERRTAVAEPDLAADRDAGLDAVAVERERVGVVRERAAAQARRPVAAGRVDEQPGGLRLAQGRGYERQR